MLSLIKLICAFFTDKNIMPLGSNASSGTSEKMKTFDITHFTARRLILLKWKLFKCYNVFVPKPERPHKKIAPQDNRPSRGIMTCDNTTCAACVVGATTGRLHDPAHLRVTVQSYFGGGGGRFSTLAGTEYVRYATLTRTTFETRPSPVVCGELTRGG